MKRIFIAVLAASAIFAPGMATAQVAISGLPSAMTPLAGTEVLPIVQGGVTKKVPASALGTTNASNLSSGTLPAARMPALTGDVTTSAGAVATTMATVNSNVGTCGDATHVPQVTLDGKGRATACNPVSISAGSAVSVTSASSNIVVSPTPGTGTFTIGATYAVNAQTGTTYTMVSGDGGKLVTFSNASAVAVTLPQGTGSFAAGWSTDVQNIGAGTVTITPTTSTVNGAATLVIPQNMGCTITSDGTNYQVSACTALVSRTVASGTSALGTSAIASGACATAVTTAATGTLTTDVIMTSFNGDPTGVTGYAPGTAGMLTIIPYPTSGSVNFKVCNNTSGSITPGAITLNWKVGPR